MSLIQGIRLVLLCAVVAGLVAYAVTETQNSGSLEQIKQERAIAKEKLELKKLELSEDLLTESAVFTAEIELETNRANLLAGQLNTKTQREKIESHERSGLKAQELVNLQKQAEKKEKIAKVVGGILGSQGLYGEYQQALNQARVALFEAETKLAANDYELRSTHQYLHACSPGKVKPCLRHASPRLWPAKISDLCAIEQSLVDLKADLETALPMKRNKSAECVIGGGTRACRTALSSDGEEKVMSTALAEVKRVLNTYFLTNSSKKQCSSKKKYHYALEFKIFEVHLFTELLMKEANQTPFHIAKVNMLLAELSAFVDDLNLARIPRSNLPTSTQQSFDDANVKLQELKSQLKAPHRAIEEASNTFDFIERRVAVAVSSLKQSSTKLADLEIAIRNLEHGKYKGDAEILMKEALKLDRLANDVAAAVKCMGAERSKQKTLGYIVAPSCLFEVENLRIDQARALDHVTYDSLIQAVKKIVIEAQKQRNKGKGRGGQNETVIDVVNGLEAAYSKTLNGNS